MLQPQDHPLLVKDSGHDLLTMNGGERRDSEVVGLSFPGEADTTILRKATLGNVHICDDLDTGNDRWLKGLTDKGSDMQDPINPKPNPQTITLGFEMDVRGLFLDGPVHQGIHQPNHLRPDIPFICFLQSVVLLLFCFLLSWSPLACCFVVHPNSPDDLGFGGITGIDVQPGLKLKFVEGRKLKGIGHGHGKPIFRK